MESKRKRYNLLKAQLDNEFSSFMPTYRDVNDFILPSRAKFFVEDRNRGDRRNQKIIDSTGTMAANTLASGMMSGVTSPARPWFRLAAPDPDLNEVGAVKQWLYLVGQRMNYVFIKSNLYNILPMCYKELGVFGTAPISIEEDFDRVIHVSSYPVGSYRIAKDSKGRVNVFFREYSMTVRQLVQMFGKRDKSGEVTNWHNFSNHVKDQYDRGLLETWVDVCYVIAPNEDYVHGSPFAKNKKYASCYYERGLASGKSYMDGADDDRYLRESGFDYFPILCPRWSVNAEDVYSTDYPGLVALGDIKELQHGEKKAAKAIDKMVDPPMVAPSSMQNSKSSILPGDITYSDTRQGDSGFRPAHEVRLELGPLAERQDQIRRRISRAFYEDLFLMLSQSDRRDITAREIDERHEEKLLAVGPVLEQLNQDLLDPLIDITFDIMQRQGLIPPAPPELQGVPLKVEYISVMAQAQKAIGVGSHERLMQTILQIMPVNPSIADKVDFDQWTDVYAENLSVTPGVIRTDEATAEIRQGKAQAQAQQAKLQAIEQGASAAKNLSQADTSGDNALTRVMEQAKAGQIVNQ